MHENDMQLPYDKCVKIDEEIDTLLKMDKEKQQLNARKAKLIRESKRSRHLAIYKWLGPNLMFEWLCGKILYFILCVSTMFLVMCADIATKYQILAIVAPSISDLIKIKMLNDKYMIPTNVIDCPISIKQKLYDVISNSSNYFLTKYVDGLYVCDVNFSGKQLYIRNKEDAKYLLDQLVDGECYSIADIITDKQVKYEKGN